MRNIKKTKSTISFGSSSSNKNAHTKIAIICITMLLISVVIFLATSLSLTHSIMQYQKQEYPVYLEPLVNYHVAFMVILVIAAIVFGGAAYHVLKENDIQNNEKQFLGGELKWPK